LQEIKQSYAPITIDVTPEGQNNPQNRDKARVRLLANDEDGDFKDIAEAEND